MMANRVVIDEGRECVRDRVPVRRTRQIDFMYPQGHMSHSPPISRDQLPGFPFVHPMIASERLHDAHTRDSDEFGDARVPGDYEDLVPPSSLNTSRVHSILSHPALVAARVTVVEVRREVVEGKLMEYVSVELEVYPWSQTIRAIFRSTSLGDLLQGCAMDVTNTLRAGTITKGYSFEAWLGMGCVRDPDGRLSLTKLVWDYLINWDVCINPSATPERNPDQVQVRIHHLMSRTEGIVSSDMYGFLTGLWMYVYGSDAVRTELEMQPIPYRTPAHQVVRQVFGSSATVRPWKHHDEIDLYGTRE